MFSTDPEENEEDGNEEQAPLGSFVQVLPAKAGSSLQHNLITNRVQKHVTMPTGGKPARSFMEGHNVTSLLPVGQGPASGKWPGPMLQIAAE